MFRQIALLTFLFNFGWAHGAIEKGISLFKDKKYEEALSAFQSKQASENQPLESLLGSLFCYIAMGDFHEIEPTIASIDQEVQHFRTCNPSLGHPSLKGPQTLEEQMMSYQCRRHVREATNQMRQTVEKLVRDTVPGFFQKVKLLRQLYPFMDHLERSGVKCCQSYFPGNCCLDPLVEQLEAWKTVDIPSPGN